MNRQEFAERQRYKTRRGAMYQGDALELLTRIPDESVQAIVTSPPFALKRKKAYGNPPQDKYIDWFKRFAVEFRRVLRDDGSLVVELGGAWTKGSPTRSVYQFELLVSLVKDEGWHLAEEFFWFNPAKLPGPGQWVNIERIRVKDAISPIWWLSKTERPKADNRKVLKPYSDSQLRLIETGTYNRGPRPSEWVIGEKFGVDHGGAIPANVIEAANTRSSDPYQAYCREHDITIHPARFPREIPDFFIRFLTDEGDTVLDPFAGSNMTCAVAEALKRKWIGFELDDEYIEGSLGRFATAKVLWPYASVAPRQEKT